MPELMP